MTNQTNGHPANRKSKRQRRPKDYDDPDRPLKADRRKTRYASPEELEDEDTPPALFRGDPSAVIPKGERLVIQGKRYFKLAPHQRTIEANAYGRFGVNYESEYGFKVLRDPRTGQPVVRDHGDLKPGEVSLVLE
jgi:hypothetical protein